MNINFKKEDGIEWSYWKYSDPLFEKFYIIGPKNFLNPEIQVLYHYPDDEDINKYNIQKFLFVEGNRYINVPLKNLNTKLGEIEKNYENIKELVIIKSEVGANNFIYCIKFRGNIYTRPAVNDNSLIEEIEFYQKFGISPSCDFAFCFVSNHPFQSILFPILKLLLEIEFKFRISSINLTCLAKGIKTPSDPSFAIWPNSTVEYRKNVLDSLFSLMLPSFGEKISFSFSGGNQYIWKMPLEADVPFEFTLWGYNSIMKWISLKDLLLLLTSLLTENPTVVVGSNVQQIVQAVTFLPRIIYPFIWLYPVITLLPSDILDFLDSPSPTMIGLLSKYKKELIKYPHFLIIDLDEKKIEFSQEFL